MSAIRLAVLADQYAIARQARLDMDKESRKLKERETELYNKLLDRMMKDQVSSIGGQTAVITLLERSTFEVEDKKAFQAYIAQNDAFDLLFSMRPSDKAVRLRVEDEVDVPGISEYSFHKLTVSKPKI